MSPSLGCCNQRTHRGTQRCCASNDSDLWGCVTGQRQICPIPASGTCQSAPIAGTPPWREPPSQRRRPAAPAGTGCAAAAHASWPPRTVQVLRTPHGSGLHFITASMQHVCIESCCRSVPFVLSLHPTSIWDHSPQRYVSSDRMRQSMGKCCIAARAYSRQCGAANTVYGQKEPHQTRNVKRMLVPG